MLKAELKHWGIDYELLVAKLKAIDVKKLRLNRDCAFVKNGLNGNFPSIFVIAILLMGVLSGHRLNFKMH